VGNGQPVQWPDRPASRNRLVGPRGVGHRTIRHERHHGIDLRVQLLDPREVRRHHIAR
jgi:hypothetical protein